MPEIQLDRIEFKAMLGARLHDFAREMFQLAALMEMDNSPEISEALGVVVDACECARSAIHHEGAL